MTDLTVIILTLNEELHISRVIQSVNPIAGKIIVVDSYSSDRTIEIARKLGAEVMQNPFINQAKQFQWALDNANIETSWIMRMDADEYLTMPLIKEISERLPLLENDISGIVLKRRVHFLGKWIKHGTSYPIHLLRIWRTHHAVVEQRWMDEHINLIKGMSIVFKHDFVDDNLNTLSWWINKHNDYATREAIEILNMKSKFMEINSTGDGTGIARQAYIKRLYKNSVYLKLPLFLRAFLYFIYRYIIRGGFWDGKKGLMWHFLQGCWYRFLVDAKILQIEEWAKQENKSVKETIEDRFKVILMKTDS
ncbi:MAG: glycosyltransferase family 2 protein [Saprospiraceae bacterium]